MRTHSQPAVTHASALAAVAAAIRAGAEAGVAVSAAVVDPGMGLVAFARADGATPHSALTSRRKANTAASTRRATGWMDATLAVAIPAATQGELTNIAGGVPLEHEGRVVGALGIAGGTPEQDAQIAVAAVASL